MKCVSLLVSIFFSVQLWATPQAFIGKYKTVHCLRTAPPQEDIVFEVEVKENVQRRGLEFWYAKTRDGMNNVTKYEFPFINEGKVLLSKSKDEYGCSAAYGTTQFVNSTVTFTGTYYGYLNCVSYPTMTKSEKVEMKLVNVDTLVVHYKGDLWLEDTCTYTRF